jgi:ABC-type phosphate/phosphonate transport system substrate-binding protein
LPYRQQRGGNLYRESIGPLTTPRRVIEAILAGEIDVGPLDSYVLDLMQHHDPDLTARIRIVATTDTAPIPFLVASRECPDDVVAALQEALIGFGDVAACADLRERLRLQGFAPVVMADYDLITRWDAEARAAGYPHPG